MDGFIHHVLCFLSYACILTGQGFICKYIFMTMRSFVHPSRELKFYGVFLCVSDRLGSSAGDDMLRYTGLTVLIYLFLEFVLFLTACPCSYCVCRYKSNDANFLSNVLR
jgi:hypothetical protein